jgi:hypothetical protein
VSRGAVNYTGGGNNDRLALKTDTNRSGVVDEYEVRDA